MSHETKKSILTRSLSALGVLGIAASPVLAISGMAFAASDAVQTASYYMPVTTAAKPLLVLDGNMTNQQNAVDSIDFGSVFAKDSVLTAGTYTVQYNQIAGTPVKFTCALDVNGKTLVTQDSVNSIVAFSIPKDIAITDAISGIDCSAVPTTLDGSQVGKELFHQGQIVFGDTKKPVAYSEVYAVFGDNTPEVYPANYQLPADLSGAYPWVILGTSTPTTPSPSTTPTTSPSTGTPSPTTSPTPTTPTPDIPTGTSTADRNAVTFAYKGLQKGGKYTLTTTVTYPDGQTKPITSNFVAPDTSGTYAVPLGLGTSPADGEYTIYQKLSVFGADPVVDIISTDPTKLVLKAGAVVTPTPSTTSPSTTPSDTPSTTPTDTPTATPTGTPTGTPTATPTGTPTATPTSPANAVVAQDDIVTTLAGKVIPIPVLTNDHPANTGGAGINIDSLKLLDSNGNPVNEYTGNGGKFAITAPGIVTFTPESGFTGNVEPVRYMVEDTAGNKGQASIKVTVKSAPSGNSTFPVPTGASTMPSGTNNTNYSTNNPYSQTASTVRTSTVPSDSGLKYYDETMAKTGSDTDKGLLAASVSLMGGGALLIGAGVINRRRKKNASE